MSTISHNNGQLSPLRSLTNHITTHDLETLQPTFHGSVPAVWTHHPFPNLAFHHIYSTASLPPSLAHNLDLVHDSKLLTGAELVIPGGSSCRIVDFAPGYETPMHRTRSLDYGVVVEGVMDLVLPGKEGGREDIPGEVRRLGVGDTEVQRGTMHAWRNASETEWARMFFVLISCEVLIVGGKALGEESGGL